jgi:mercuric reductase
VISFIFDTWAEMKQKELEITGMTCDACARHLESAIREAGAERASVDWRRGKVRAAGGLDTEALKRALAGTQYGLGKVRETTESGDRDGAGARFDLDLIVIGSGGGAFAAAIRARDLDKRVLMVERGTTGGTCVNVGCIPSKALLVRSKLARAAGAPTLADALATKGELVEGLRQRKYVDLLDRYEIDHRAGDARVIDPHTVEIDGEAVSAGAVLIAAGARPAVPSIPGLDRAGYLTSTDALELAEAPPRLAVLGAGPVGLELGQMLGNFGSQVTFIARRGLAPRAEPEVSGALREVLENEGHAIVAPAITAEVALEGREKVLRGRSREEPFELRVDEILVATGRTPNTDGLGLEDAGVELDPFGAIVVDAEQRTTVPSIFAAGDVTTQPRFVYVAAAGGAAGAENALGGRGQELDFAALPQVVFTSPAIAQTGLTEAEARERGYDVATTVLPLEAVPRALVDGDTRGLFKLVAEGYTGRLLGATILAAGAPDVIQSAVLAIERRITVGELASTWAPYLAMAEGLKLAAQTFERDVANLSCCAA